MTYYEFHVLYDSEGKVIFSQCTGDEEETNTRPLPVWLSNCAGKNMISQWYRSDEIVFDGYRSYTVERLLDKFDDQVWIGYHESGSYYDTSLEGYTERYREEQKRKYMLN